MHTMASEANASRPQRRFYSPELKCQVTQECRQSGASVAGVALSYGINANIVQRWLREPAQDAPLLASQGNGFVAVALDDPVPGLAPQQSPAAHWRGRHHYAGLMLCSAAELAVYRGICPSPPRASAGTLQGMATVVNRAPESLTNLSALELREMVTGLMARIGEHDPQIGQRDETIVRKDREILYRQTKIDQLTHEMAVLKRWKFGRSREQLDSTQASLLDEAIDADIAAIELELQTLAPVPPADAAPRQQPKRAALPPELPRIDQHHESESTTCTTAGCGCTLKRIGEDVSEKLDYTPGLLTVERHIRGKWACAQCQTLTQALVPAQIIDKGIPTAGLLAQVPVAKYADHLPLYRQEGIFARAGMAIPRSTLGAWVGLCGVQLQPLVDALRQVLLGHRVLHADETPVAMLKPGNQKKHRAYLWAYAPGAFEDMKAVIYDFCESRAGEHARAFLGTGRVRWFVKISRATKSHLLRE